MIRESLVKLRWPIKESFQDYVTAAEGTIEVSDEVTRDGKDFVFPQTKTDDGTLAFSGHVELKAHGGLLAVIVADPIIVWNGEEGTLSARTGHDPDALRIDIIDITRVPDSVPLQATSKLTFDGSRLLGDVYLPGQAIDSLEVVE